jgi:ABC-type glycerol-3-phosphate transport system substrate-binding protein
MNRGFYRQQLSRRDTLRLAAAFAGGSVLTARGVNPMLSAQDEPIVVPDFVSEVEPTPVRLELWTFGETHQRWFDAMAAAYREQVNPDFELTVVLTAYEEHHNKLLISLQSGGVGAPDLVDIEQGRFGAFIKGDIGFADLTDKLRSGGYLDQLVATREALYSVGDTIYGVEHALTPVVLYCRSDLYEAAGIELPLKTWDDFTTATKELATEDVLGTPIDWDFYDLVLRQRGSDTFDKDGNVTADSSEAIETLEWMLGLRDEHRVAAEPPAGAQAFGTAADQTFFGAVNEGRFVALPGADWFAGHMKDYVPDLAGKWRAQHLPAFTDGGLRTSVWGGTGLAIVNTSEKQDAAWDFIRYAMLTTEGNVQRYLAINLWPPFKPAWEDDRMYSPDEYFGGQDLGRLFAEVGAEAPAQYQSPYRADFNVLRRDKYTRDVFDGRLSPAEGLKQLSDEIRQLQERGQ